MTVDAFREKVVNFMYEIYITFTQINDNAITNRKIIATNYFIASKPSNYVNIIHDLSASANKFVWMNEKDEFLAFTQTLLTNLHQFNSEHGELSEKIINDTPCLVCVDNDLYYCYWEFDDYRFELVYPIDLGEEFMSEVVGNLVEIDPAELES